MEKIQNIHDPVYLNTKGRQNATLLLLLGIRSLISCLQFTLSDNPRRVTLSLTQEEGHSCVEYWMLIYFLWIILTEEYIYSLFFNR